MLARLNRKLRAVQLLAQYSANNSGLWLFYGSHQLSSSFLNKLFYQFGARGFYWNLFGASWTPSRFWPKHPAYAYMYTGYFYGLYWPSLDIWLEAQSQFSPNLTEVQLGLWNSHFFFDLVSIQNSKLIAPFVVCGTLFDVWASLVVFFENFNHLLLNILNNNK